MRGRQEKKAGGRRREWRSRKERGEKGERRREVRRRTERG